MPKTNNFRGNYKHFNDFFFKKYNKGFYESPCISQELLFLNNLEEGHWHLLANYPNYYFFNYNPKDKTK